MENKSWIQKQSTDDPIYSIRLDPNETYYLGNLNENKLKFLEHALKYRLKNFDSNDKDLIKNNPVMSFNEIDNNWYLQDYSEESSTTDLIWHFMYPDKMEFTLGDLSQEIVKIVSEITGKDLDKEAYENSVYVSIDKDLQTMLYNYPANNAITLSPRESIQYLKWYLKLLNEVFQDKDSREVITEDKDSQIFGSSRESAEVIPEETNSSRVPELIKIIMGSNLGHEINITGKKLYVSVWEYKEGHTRVEYSTSFMLENSDKEVDKVIDTINILKR